MTLKSILTRRMKTLGIYHKDCIDGTGAAAVLLRKFPEIRLFPLRHVYSPETIAPVKEAARGSELYFVDCAIGIHELLPLASKVTVIDHHISVKDELDMLARDGKITYVFDNEKSGASLAWAPLFPDEPLPEVIRYIEDGDLARFNYGEETKRVTNYLSMHINNPERMLELMSADIEVIKKDGKVIAAYVDYHIQKMTDDARSLHLRIGTHDIPAYNITIYQSAVGKNLARAGESVAALFTIYGDRVKLSFRSEDGQEPSALDLAQALGGGGHHNASGANIPLKQFLGMIVPTP